MSNSDPTLRERLIRQRLSGAHLDKPADVVRWLGAVQSQDFGGGKWALGLRVTGLTEAEITRAYDAGEFIRTHVLRPTWHFVAPEDLRWMLALTKDRVLQQGKHQFRQLNLTDEVFARAEAVMAEALKGGQYLTRDELSVHFTAAGINLDTPAGFGAISGHLMMHAELVGLVCSGPMRGKKFTYALVKERVPPAAPPADPVGELAARYLQGRSPATLADFVWWSGLTVGQSKVAFERALDQLPPPTAAGTAPTAYLLPNYDEYLVAYADRSLPAGDAPVEGLDARANPLFQNTIVYDGRVVGTWQRTLKSKRVEVNAKPFKPLDSEATLAIHGAAERYASFLGSKLDFT